MNSRFPSELRSPGGQVMKTRNRGDFRDRNITNGDTVVGKIIKFKTGRYFKTRGTSREAE